MRCWEVVIDDNRAPLSVLVEGDAEEAGALATAAAGLPPLNEGEHMRGDEDPLDEFGTHGQDAQRGEEPAVARACSS